MTRFGNGMPQLLRTLGQAHHLEAKSKASTLQEPGCAASRALGNGMGDTEGTAAALPARFPAQLQNRHCFMGLPNTIHPTTKCTRLVIWDPYMRTWIAIQQPRPTCCSNTAIMASQISVPTSMLPTWAVCSCLLRRGRTVPRRDLGDTHGMSPSPWTAKTSSLCFSSCSGKLVSRLPIFPGAGCQMNVCVCRRFCLNSQLLFVLLATWVITCRLPTSAINRPCSVPACRMPLELRGVNHTCRWFARQCSKLTMMAFSTSSKVLPAHSSDLSTFSLMAK